MRERKINKRYIQPLLTAIKRSALTLKGDTGQQIVVDISNSSDLRGLRQLLILFQSTGREVFIVARFNKLTAAIVKELKWHDGVKLLWRAAAARKAKVLCTDGVDTNEHKYNGQKRISLCYDYGPKLNLGALDYAMPFTMHPQIYSQFPIRSQQQLQDLRQTRRRVRVLFAGNCREGYSNPLISETFGKLTRAQIIEFLEDQNLVKSVKSLTELNDLYNSVYFNGLIFVDTGLFRISQGNWMKLMTETDFFLCPPGVLMPLCHNMIEAMAVGTIPLTNYADWMHPHLTHAENCLSFATLEDLKQRLYEIFSLKDEEITGLRASVIDYYDTYLSPRIVGERLLNAPEQNIRLHLVKRTVESLRHATLS